MIAWSVSVVPESGVGKNSDWNVMWYLGFEPGN